MRIFYLLLLLVFLRAEGFDYQTAQEYYQKKDYSQAIWRFNYILANQKVLEPYLKYYLADCYYQQGNYAEAIPRLREIVQSKRQPYYMDAYNKLLDALKKSDQKDALTSADKYFYGEDFFRKGDYASARNWFEAVSKNNLEDVQLYLGRIAIVQNRHKDAVEILKPLTGEKARNYLILAYAYNKQNDKVSEELQKFWQDFGYTETGLNLLQKLNEINKNQYLSLIKEKYPTANAVLQNYWQEGRKFYKQKNFVKAQETFYYGYKINPQSDLADSLLFWSAKSAAKSNTENVQNLFKKTSEKFPLRYYGFRAKTILGQPLDINLKQNNDQPDLTKISTVVSMLVQQKAYADAMEEIELIIKNKEQSDLFMLYYALSEIASKNNKFKRSIQAAFTATDKYLKNNQNNIPKKLLHYLFPLEYNEEIKKNIVPFDNVDQHLIQALIREESLYDAEAYSHANAYGLMQIIPSTAQSIAQRLNHNFPTIEKLFEPETNIYFGVFYLQHVLKMFDNNKFLALSAYNAGPSITSKWAKKLTNQDLDEFVEDIPYNETRMYIKRVMRSYWCYQALYN